MSRFDSAIDSLPMWLSYSVIVSVLLVSFHLSSSSAADILNIRDLKNNAMSYQLRTVTLHGTVKNLRVFPPHPGKVCTVYGSYAFTLVEESGEVDVEKVGLCNDEQHTPSVDEGDDVTIQGQVQFFHAGDLGTKAPTILLHAQEVMKIGQ